MTAYLILLQYIATAASAGFNACYFLRYRSPHRRRRIGALTLALLSAAILMESLYFTGLDVFLGREIGDSFFFSPGYWLAARLLVFSGSLVVSGLILRRMIVEKG